MPIKLTTTVLDPATQLCLEQIAQLVGVPVLVGHAANGTMVPWELAIIGGSITAMVLPLKPTVDCVNYVANYTAGGVTVSPGGSDVINVFGTGGADTVATLTTRRYVYSSASWVWYGF
jgi:hypothetical protein